MSMIQSAGHRPGRVRRIVVLRAGGLGDFVFALPALEALRATFPEADIAVVGEGWQRELLAGRPSPVDRFVALSPTARQYLTDGTIDDERKLEAFFTAVRGPGVDLAVQIHGGGRTSN